ncbi:hypothetical protein CGZ98_02725 [Enemella evansiae]|uniref:adenosine deaminase family protein n=1 Tax=Enemella evansiae TaxID=2016499 RepID=UPI000B96EA73|nr:hypothetical protein [Enemella evansiae]OYO15351.1 hypothetical protein CGZ98_02725 [Enemella evansiae]
MSPNVISRLPKTDLHCHLMGTMTAGTFAELSAKAGLDLPDDPTQIFASICSKPADPVAYRDAVIPVPTEPAPDEPDPAYSLFVVSDWARRSLVDPEDFARLTYEACANAFHSSNTRHLEMSIDPHEDYWRLDYGQALEAYVAGIKRAEEEFGMTARLLQAIDRSKSGEDAVRAVRQAVEHPNEYLVGIGLDNLETSGPPERFAEAYALAESAGLRRTAHSSEHAISAQNTITCLDLLHCDRIDHGYFVLQDQEVITRCAAEEVPFTVISTTSRRSLRPWRRASIKAMHDAGLTLCLSSDDPGMFPTTLANEYRIAEEQIGLSTEQLVEICVNGWRASWLPEEDKQARIDEVREVVAAAR